MHFVFLPQFFFSLLYYPLVNSSSLTPAPPPSKPRGLGGLFLEKRRHQSRVSMRPTSQPTRATEDFNAASNGMTSRSSLATTTITEGKSGEGFPLESISKQTNQLSSRHEAGDVCFEKKLSQFFDIFRKYLSNSLKFPTPQISLFFMNYDIVNYESQIFSRFSKFYKLTTPKQPIILVGMAKARHVRCLASQLCAFCVPTPPTHRPRDHRGCEKITKTK